MQSVIRYTNTGVTGREDEIQSSDTTWSFFNDSLSLVNKMQPALYIVIYPNYFQE